MSFERPITIYEVIENIERKKYFLPSIQREFVWDTDQIEILFDSLMKDYPIGSFLFWSVDKENKKKFQFYEFIREYSEYNTSHNPKANIDGDYDITGILDGQQRFTSLYLGLKGSYAYRLPRKKRDDIRSYPKRYLYLNLLSKSDDIDKEYDFNFLTEDEASLKDENKFWFKVGEILNIKQEYEVNDYLINNKLLKNDEQSKFANQTLFKLFSIIHKKEIINYFLEKDKSLDKVLNIFIRVNSGGTELSYSDLLLSIATAQWKEKDAREEIINFVEEIRNTGNKFNFNKDFVLKTCLVLCDFSDIAFKVDNFNSHNMLEIEKKWDNIADSIFTSVQLISEYGYNYETLTSNNALIPIIYFIYKNNLNEVILNSTKQQSNRDKIKKYLILSLLKRIFSGQPDNVLRPIREILLKNIKSRIPVRKNY